ncbi:C40 family peptidase [Paenibacillus sp. GCM10027626]|uniref:C40 family peptidase n=1 Tax=Paenibacillus sp. GCM10027626 TaxID=3273411 RepID=UPI0036372794
MGKKVFLTFVFAALIAGGLSACLNKEPIAQRKGEADPHEIQEEKRLSMQQDKGSQQWRTVADAIIAEGMKYWGTPYVYGAERFNDKTFDCSSYVQYLYANHGISLGYNSREQALQGIEVPFINLRKGDLMFFSDEDFPDETGLNKVRHVGIYMGDGKILHTYEPGIGVVISNIHKDEKEGEYWYQNYLFARRVIPD